MDDQARTLVFLKGLFDFAFFIKLIADFPDDFSDLNDSFRFTEITVLVVRIVFVRVCGVYSLLDKRRIIRG